MGIWKLDLTTARYIADDMLQNKDHLDGLSFTLEECPKCGASYIEKLGHDCTNTIDLDTDTVTEEDEVTSLEDFCGDVVLKYVVGDCGLDKATIDSMLCRVDMAQGVYPIEIADTRREGTAMGFITVDAAKRIDFEYSQDSKFGVKVQEVLDEFIRRPYEIVSASIIGDIKVQIC